jgi:hypothetical protein
MVSESIAVHYEPTSQAGKCSQQGAGVEAMRATHIQVLQQCREHGMHAFNVGLAFRHVGTNRYQTFSSQCHLQRRATQHATWH